MDNKKIIVIVLAVVAAVVAVLFMGKKEEKPKTQNQEDVIQQEEKIEEQNQEEQGNNENQEQNEKEDVDDATLGNELVAISEDKKIILSNAQDVANKNVYIYKNKNVNDEDSIEEKLKIVTTKGGTNVVLLNMKKHLAAGLDEKSFLLDAENTYQRKQDTNEIIHSLTSEGKEETERSKEINKLIQEDAKELEEYLTTFLQVSGEGQINDKEDKNYTIDYYENQFDGESQYGGKRIEYYQKRMPSQKYIETLKEKIEKEGTTNAQTYEFMIKELLKTEIQISLHYTEDDMLQKIEIFSYYSELNEGIDKITEIPEEKINKIIQNNIYTFVPSWEEENYIDKQLFDGYK